MQETMTDLKETVLSEIKLTTNFNSTCLKSYLDNTIDKRAITDIKEKTEKIEIMNVSEATYSLYK